MQLLTRAASFTSHRQDLRKIYITFVRSILEQSAVVWNSSLSVRNKQSLERVKKCAVRSILGRKYTTYKDGLLKLNLQNLKERRKQLCLKFAKKCLSNEKTSKMFPKNQSTHKMEKRRSIKFKLAKVKTKRYKNSAIPYMARLLNIDEEKKKLIMKEQ